MIIKEHRDFAQAVVALAREHGMYHVNMTFRIQIALEQELPRCAYDDVTMIWAQGRHGDTSTIRLQTMGGEHIPEKPETKK
jgi:hypothetical protein